VNKRRKKKAAIQKKSGKSRSSRWLRSLWKLGLLLTGVLSGLLAPWILYLNYQVTTEFEGRKWDLPSRVYARSLELYPGSALPITDLEMELAASGYRAAIRLLESGRVAVEEMHTHNFALSDAELAIRTLAREIPGDESIHSCLIPEH